MVQMLCDLFLNKTDHNTAEYQKRCVSLEHIRVRGNSLEVCGEHIMSSDGSLVLRQDFFGADEALTSYQPEKNSWVATMIFAGKSHDEIAVKRKNCYEAIISL
jgi:pyrrolysine biosynthesis protein PylC